MVSSNMYTLTQALKGVFVETPIIDESDQSVGSSFSEISRMEEFWEVKKIKSQYKNKQVK